MRIINLLNPASLASVTTKALKEKSEQFNTTQLRISRDYPWKVLDALVHDLESICDIDDLRQIRDVIRQRSVEKLNQLHLDWSPQRMSPDLTIAHLTKLRSRLMIVSLLKKFPFPEGSDESRITSALKKFIKAEISCRNYNAAGYKEFTDSEQIHVRSVFIEARKWIQEVIGNELPDDKYLTLRSRHGPGASTNTSFGNTSSYFKYSEWPYDVTSNCRDNAITAITADERWIGALEDSYRQKFGIPKALILNRKVFWDNVLNIVPGNKIAFVPKSYETHRTIAIEPTMNLYLQLGVDGYIRQRLKPWLINLDDQSRNQKLAGLGSAIDTDVSYCTIDLSMASDTVALRLVRDLLPKAWYDYLLALRSPRGHVDALGINRCFTYEKISSMGNGFTFALESLIFSAISHAVIKVKSGKFQPSSVAVYGDDIIVPKLYVTDVMEFLKRAGFTMNQEKSFIKGPFRESCGADWFHGQPVRAIFLKKFPKTVKDLYNDFNRINRCFQLFFGVRPENLTLLFKKFIPFHLQMYGPVSDTEFDTYIHSQTNLRGYWQNGEFLFYRLVSKVPEYHGKRVNQFLFRKLMARLTHTPPSVFGNEECSGKAFSVKRGKSSPYMALTYSAVCFWQTEYSHVLTPIGVNA